MREVAIVGAGMIRFGKYLEKSIKDLVRDSVELALEDAGIDREKLDAAYVGSAAPGIMTGQEQIKAQVTLSAMGIDTTGMTEWEAADHWFYEIEQLLKDLDITPGHLTEQFGIQEKDLDHIVSIYKNDFCSQGNPMAFDYDEVTAVLKGAL